MHNNLQITRNLSRLCRLYIVLCFSILFVLTFIYQHFDLNYKTLRTPTFWVTAIAAIAIAIVDHFQFLKCLQQSIDRPLEERLKSYRRATLFRFTVIETVSIIFGILFLLTGSSIFQLEASLGAFLMLYFYPSSIKISNDLHIVLQDLE